MTWTDSFLLAIGGSPKPQLVRGYNEAYGLRPLFGEQACDLTHRQIPVAA